MLESRGIVVTGKARATHRIPMDAEGFMTQMKKPGYESFVLGDDKGPQPNRLSG